MPVCFCLPSYGGAAARTKECREGGGAWRRGKVGEQGGAPAQMREMRGRVWFMNWTAGLF